MNHDLFTLPLKNPVLIFSLILFIILLAPAILARLRIPHVIGLILAGVIIGPHGANLMARDASVVLFGTVGVLYIMFLAGLEVDIADFIRNRNLSLVFGSYTFIIPMLIGTLAAKFILGLSWPTAVLLASMFASHTLVAYPIATRYGVVKDTAVTLTIGGTILTDTLALLVLAVIVGMTKGSADAAFWLRLGISIALFATLVLGGIPPLARLVYKRLDDPIAQYIFTLAIVFLCAFLAEVAGVEGIIGAFLAGLALNRLIPHTSPLMNRIEFVGNALFIPFFLIGVGMLVNLKVLFLSSGALLTAAVMTTVALLSKYIAAYLTQKTFSLNSAQRGLVFGLSSAQAAATLAAVLVGYNIVIGHGADGSPIRLLNEDILNGTILMILVTCTAASFATERAARKIAENHEATVPEAQQGGLLIAFSETTAVTGLFDLALAMTNRKAGDFLHGIHIVNDKNDASASVAESRRLVESAEKYAAGAGYDLPCDLRVDLNVSAGLVSVATEHRTEEFLLGLHRRRFLSRSALGHIVENLLETSGNTVYLLRSVQPLGTYKRLVVAIPPGAERDFGFSQWFRRIRNLAINTGMPTVFYCNAATEQEIRRSLKAGKDTKPVAFSLFEDWELFATLAGELQPNDFFVCILARKGSFSAQQALLSVPEIIQKHFQRNSTLLVFPRALSSTGHLAWGQMETEFITPLRDFWRKSLRGLRRRLRK